MGLRVKPSTSHDFLRVFGHWNLGRIPGPAFVRYRSERQHHECERGYPVVSPFLCRSGIRVAHYSVSFGVEVQDPILSHYIIPLEALCIDPVGVVLYSLYHMIEVGSSLSCRTIPTI